jgi:hypothetical protein
MKQRDLQTLYDRALRASLLHSPQSHVSEVPGRTWGWLGPLGSLCNELFILHSFSEVVIAGGVDDTHQQIGSHMG